MSDPENNEHLGLDPLATEVASIINDEHADPKSVSIDFRKLAMEEDLNNPIALVERVYQIWRNWADFHLFIISPTIDLIHPTVIMHPETLPGSTMQEFVYAIHDSGSRLSTSKGEEMFSAGMSMCKLYYTIEKMISILVNRLKDGGISKETEVQVAFGGHQLAQRKAFESIINLSYNVVVTNFDPGVWGERYLQTVKRVADKGYGYPSETPRDIYKLSRQDSTAGISR